jgi:hypothetical protein
MKTVKTVTMPKSTSNVLVIPTPVPATGHKPHRSGAGKHGDRRTRRQRTRSAQRRQALAD